MPITNLEAIERAELDSIRKQVQAAAFAQATAILGVGGNAPEDDQAANHANRRAFAQDFCRVDQWDRICKIMAPMVSVEKKAAGTATTLDDAEVAAAVAALWDLWAVKEEA